MSSAKVLCVEYRLHWKNGKEQIEALEILNLKVMERIKWVEKQGNEEYQERVKEEKVCYK